MMSPLEHVLAAAKSVASTGKQPSLVLIKTKLGNSVPLPILIQGLQQFKSMSLESIAQIQTPDTHLLQPENTQEISELDKLKQEIKQLKDIYQQLNIRISQLEIDHKVQK
ncbi:MULTISPECIES: hypothetical protein [unclassified Shewanella]|uniref:hypothetical protein n=1 Tax=unclassified Shewanella TaxID=196818 RepID=UPI003FA35CB8